MLEVLADSIALLAGASLLICGIAAMLTALDESRKDDEE